MTNENLVTALSILRDAAVEKDDAMPPELAKALLNEIEHLREALELAALRFDDLGGIVDREPYRNGGFMRASATRCRTAASGGSFHDSHNDLCLCGKRIGEHPAQPPWWPCMVRAAVEPEKQPMAKPIAWLRRFEDGTYDVWHDQPRESDHGDPRRWKVVPLYERPADEPTCAHEWKEPATRWERLERLASEFNEPKAEPLRPTYQEQQFFCESCKLAMVVSGKSDFTVVAMHCTCGHVTQVNRGESHE